MDSTIYDSSNLIQNQIIEKVIPHIKPYLEQYFNQYKDNISKFPFFNYVDYGCATGKNTINLFNLIYYLFIKNQPDGSFLITFSDLYTNDFKITYDCFKKYMKLNSKIFHQIVVGSFYQNLLPPSSAMIITCNNSVHWLATDDVDILNEFIIEPKIFRNEKIRNKIEETAKQNYIDFLKSKEQELITDGLLIITGPSDGLLMSKQSNIFKSSWKETLDILGLEKLMKYMSLRVYLRSEEEFLDPINQKIVNFEKIKIGKFENKIPFDNPKSFVNITLPFISYNLKNIYYKYFEIEYGYFPDDEIKNKIKNLFILNLEKSFSIAINEGYNEIDLPGFYMILKKNNKIN